MLVQIRIFRLDEKQVQMKFFALMIGRFVNDFIASKLVYEIEQMWISEIKCKTIDRKGNDYLKIALKLT